MPFATVLLRQVFPVRRVTDTIYYRDPVAYGNGVNGQMIFTMRILILDFRDNANFRVSDELDDVTDMGTVGHLFLYLLHDIKDGCLTVE